MGDLEIGVECYAGYRGEETPRRLRLSDRTVEIREVVDRWLAPDHRYFKVVGEDGATYIVRQDQASGAWRLTLYESSALASMPRFGGAPAADA